MPNRKLRLKIVTPFGVKLDEEIDMAIVRSTTGDMGFKPGHAPYSAALETAALRIIKGNIERRIAVFGGIAEMNGENLTVLTQSAEWPEDIDRARAEVDRKMAETRLREREGDIELQNDQVLLRRSLVRIEVSAYPLVNNPTGAPATTQPSKGE